MGASAKDHPAPANIPTVRYPAAMTYVGNITRDVYREFPVLTVALLAMGAVGCEEANVPLTQVIVVKPDDNSTALAPERVGRRCAKVGDEPVAISLPQSTVAIGGTVKANAKTITFASSRSGVGETFGEVCVPCE